MFIGMNFLNNPELMKLAQEMRRQMSPAELANLQQQVLANYPGLKMASECMKNMSPEDLNTAVEQMKHTSPKKMASVLPKAIAAMNEDVNYKLNAAKMLKKEGNELHNQRKFNDALQKYALAKKNLSGLPSSEERSLLKACSLNLMSCYLKTGQYDECIKEGYEVLAYDAKNAKASYRRGLAYKELGRFENAVSDLGMAHEVSPDDETIADALRDAKDKVGTEGSVAAPRGLVIEEITEEVETVSAADHESSSTEYSVAEPQETMTKMTAEEPQNMFGTASSMTGRDPSPTPASFSAPQSTTPDFSACQEVKMNQMNDPAVRQMCSEMMSMSPDLLAKLSGTNCSPEDAEKMMSSLTPESLEKMMLSIERVQRVVENGRKMKEWILGNAGLIFAIVMCILAVIFGLRLMPIFWS